jgi:TonB-dependent receptor
MNATRVLGLRSVSAGLVLGLLGAWPLPAAAQTPGAESVREQADEQAADAAGEAVPEPPGDVEEFLVVAPPLQEILAASRMDADELINTLDAAELAKFAASDVADALKFVPGVSVVEGQFAIIRGLEDRYNSTLYNRAPVPSPDPDSQSVQLDLFPSDIVGNLVVSKTFSPDLPSNSSGGAIDIVTHDYPDEELQIKLGGGGGFETGALDRFLRLDDGSPTGIDTDWQDVIESDAGASIGGRRSLLGRELRFKGVLNQEIDYRTAEGFQESREPRLARTRNFPRPPCPCVTGSGDLALGELGLSGGRFDLTESERSEQRTGYGGLGIDLDEAGDHKLDGSIFHTRKDEETVQLEENGYFPRFDYGALAAIQAEGREVTREDFSDAATPTSWLAGVRGSPSDDPSRGPLWYDAFFESQAFQRDRELTVYQLNGEHRIAWIDGLHFAWAGNHAKTTQEETTRGARIFYEAEDTADIPTRFPATPGALGPGQYYATPDLFLSVNEIEETQDFARFDADYQRELGEHLTLTVNGGFWYEKADRDVVSSFLETPAVAGSTQFAIPGRSLEELGGRVFDELQQTDGELAGVRTAENEASREITAWSFGGKATLWDRLDLLGGLRIESIFIESLNDAFTGQLLNGAPATFPSQYLLFDRLDNQARGEITSPVPPGTTFNDQLIGIRVPIDPATGLVDLTDRASIESLINGEIDERLYLPSFAIHYRPIEGLNLRAAWSRTSARPSFRELGYYVSVEPGTDDRVVGNPQLVLSDVESWDARVEYTWGEFGDLAALSVFYKTIDDPIESIVLRDPINREASDSSAFYRTFFNNPNQGTLKGVELEARKNLGIVPFEFARYFSIGGNFTWIDAEVDRTEAELARSRPFFGAAPGDPERFSDLSSSRRLFGQPEWIANVDLTFEHPDWGTKVSLIFFAISDVLDAAGSASLNANNNVFAFTLDRYVDSYHQLDLSASQTWHVDFLRGDLTLRAGVKNLTNSARGLIYDPEQTRDEVAERSYQIGRDVSFSLSYTFTF